MQTPCPYMDTKQTKHLRLVKVGVKRIEQIVRVACLLAHVR
jgi:hypothetical protein